MIIRDEMPADIAAVRDLIRVAFHGHPYSSGTEPAIMGALRAAGAADPALVAEADGAVVGQAAFSPVTIDGAASGWHGLGPVAVRPDRQRRGVGQALVRAGLDRLRARGAAGCVVVGDPAYYGRFGFRADERVRLPGVPAEHFMILPFGPAVPTGTVAFHPAFQTGG